MKLYMQKKEKWMNKPLSSSFIFQEIDFLQEDHQCRKVIQTMRVNWIIIVDPFLLKFVNPLTYWKTKQKKFFFLKKWNKNVYLKNILELNSRLVNDSESIIIFRFKVKHLSFQFSNKQKTKKKCCKRLELKETIRNKP